MPLTPPDAVPALPLTCMIMESRSPSAARVSLRLHAKAGVSGQYTLIVKKSDGAGSSTMRQGGAFDLPAGATGDFAQVAVSVGADGRLVITGSIDVAGGHIVCESAEEDRL